MTQGRSRWEPRRWSEGDSDAPVALRAALQDARTVTAEGAQVARLAERLGIGGGAAAVGAVGGVAGAGTAAGIANTLPPSAAVAYKLWAYLSGVVVVSGVALVLGTELGAGLSDQEIGSATVTLLPEPVVNGATDLTAGGSNVEAVVDAPVLTAVSAATEARPAHVAPSASRAGAGRAVVRRASVALPTSHRSDVAIKLDPEAELRILNGAQDALRQAPHRALTLAEDHAHMFPRGVFAQEREVIAIEALMKLQRSDDAAERGRAFLTEFPTSTHASRVQQLLGDAQP